MISALAAAVIASCVWDAPRGLYAVTDVKPSSLIDHYRDIPEETRKVLKSRMDSLKYDDVAEIRNGSILGKWEYSDLRNMHFGAKGGTVCSKVVVSNWTAQEAERALIYCEQGHCIAVPTVCRNTSQITRGRLRTPPPIPADPPAAEIPPVPFALEVPIPRVEPGPLSDEYTPQTFSRLSLPTPDTDPPVKEPEPERITADQTFYELWSRPLLYGRVSWSLFSWPTATPLVVSFQPVPSVFPSIPSSPVFDSPIIVRTPDGLPGSIAPIPEPGTIVLMLCGLLGVWLMARRQTA